VCRYVAVIVFVKTNPSLAAVRGGGEGEVKHAGGLSTSQCIL